MHKTSYYVCVARNLTISLIPLTSYYVCVARDLTISLIQMTCYYVDYADNVFTISIVRRYNMSCTIISRNSDIAACHLYQRHNSV